VSVDLLRLVRLLHQVTGFLSRLSPAQLAGIAEGSLTLGLVGTEDERGAPGPVPAEPRRAIAAPRQAAAKTDPAADVDYAEIAATLRGKTTVEDGLAYLKGLRLRGRKPLKSDLIAIGRELKLTLPASTRIDDATSRIIHHAIGNRRKYEGLRP
jgi:hypothetical protein